MAGTGMGVMATIVAVNRNWIGRDYCCKATGKNGKFLCCR